jgi:mannose-1-phosphate guanylyltransferase
VHAVERFVEKPDRATAEGYLADGRHLWNSGIFTWRVDTVIAGLEQHASWLIEALAPVEAAWGSPVFAERLAIAYDPLRRISIDYALLEKAEHIRVLTAPFAWDDVGSWDALYDHLPVDQDGVIQRGRTLAVGCKDSMFLGETGQLIAAVGLEGVTVVCTEDAILICGKGASQGVKEVVQRLSDGGRDDLL